MEQFEAMYVSPIKANTDITIKANVDLNPQRSKQRDVVQPLKYFTWCELIRAVEKQGMFV